MNDFVVLIENVAGFRWLQFIALIVVAAAILLLDREPKKRGAEGAKSARDRMAA